MYCIKCGADNSETAAYCRKCGAKMETEDETRVSPKKDYLPPSRYMLPDESRMERTSHVDDSSHGNEAEIFSISPTMMFIKAGYVQIAIGAPVLVALVSAILPGVSTWIAVLIALLLFLIPAYYHIRKKLVRYTLTDTKLEIDEGFISRKTRTIPIRRIQDVTVSSGVTQRMLGFGDLVIDNAGESGERVILKNINTPKHYADLLLKQLRRLDVGPGDM
jgi:membrane protein YdbS with pleckstrin-like domain